MHSRFHAAALRISGVSNPARELMFTVVARDEKYKAKNLIDTAILRGGDVAWSWAFTGLLGAGLTTPYISAIAVPIALIWLVLSLWLGRNQEKRAAQMEAATQIEGGKA